MQIMDASVKHKNTCTGTNLVFASGPNLFNTPHKSQIYPKHKSVVLHTYMLALCSELDDRGAVTSIHSPILISVVLLAPVHILLKRMNKSWHHQSFSLLKVSGV